MSDQKKLVSLLKQKGTGKTMSKSLTEEQCSQLQHLLLSNNVSVTTVTTLLVAFFMLENTETEKDFFNNLCKNFKQLCPKESFFLFDSSYRTHDMHHLVAKIITHKSCTENEMLQALNYCVSSDAEEHVIATFLEGLRLKEESNIENISTLDFVYNRAQFQEIKSSTLIDLATAYDGFNRHPNLVLFLAPLLAAMGFNVNLHGCYDHSPKYGITFHKLLKEAGKQPLRSLSDVANLISNTDIGWGYCDQAIYHPDLWNLKKCRDNMVKRPVLATVEKFCCPIRTSGKHIIVTGFTHPAYRKKQ